MGYYLAWLEYTGLYTLLKDIMAFTPNSVNSLQTGILNYKLGQIAHPLNNTYMDLLTMGWKFYAVQQSRGRCYQGRKVITIPMFAMLGKKDNFLTWYIAHEMAHAFTAWDAKSHGPEFMANLKAICPVEAQHWEMTYQPREAVLARLDLSSIVDQL